MTNYTIAIPKDSPVFKLYQKLKDDGVQDDDLDTGYPETDFVKKTRKTVHQGDHKIEETEVLNYALEHYERYQLAIKETTGYVVPWSLDDLDPATDFDSGIRAQVDRAITAFKQILADQGLKEGNGRYNELLAVSLFALALTSVRGVIPDQLKPELVKEGLSKVIDHLTKSGGLALQAEKGEPCESEATALETLAQGCGMCSEQSKVVYAVFRAAGLKPRSIYVIPGYKVKLPAGSLHMSVEISLDGGKKRIFDPALGLSNAGPTYKENKLFWWFEVTGAELLAVHFSNSGEKYNLKGKPDLAIPELTTALKIDPNSAVAHTDLGNFYAQKGELDLAILEFKMALKLDPNFAETHHNMGTAYYRKGELERAIAEYKIALKLNPDFAEAHGYLGGSYCEKSMKYEKENKIDDALRLFQSALKEWNKARELGASPSREYELDALDRIKKILDAKAKIGPSRDVAYKLAQLGDEYYKIFETIKARACYEQAAKMDPQSVTALRGVWNTYKRIYKAGVSDEYTERVKLFIKVNQACEQYKKVSHDKKLVCDWLNPPQ